MNGPDPTTGDNFPDPSKPYQWEPITRPTPHPFRQIQEEFWVGELLPDLCPCVNVDELEILAGPTGTPAALGFRHAPWCPFNDDPELD